MLSLNISSATDASTASGQPPVPNVRSSSRGALTSAKLSNYEQLLSHFPPSLHDAIRQTLPDAAQLQQFHQGFVDRESPLTEKSVAHALTAVRDHRIATEEQDRLHYISEFQHDDLAKSHDIYGATLLHHAILNEDIGLTRALLNKATTDKAAIIQPRMRQKDGMRIAHAVGSLPPSSGEGEVHQAILGALKNRATGGSRTATAFAGHAGDNPLTFALQRHASKNMIMLLLEHYASRAPAMLSTPDANGTTPLLAAAASGRTDIARLLLQQPAVNINGANEQGQDAVMQAVIAGDTGMLDLLLAFGPDLERTDAQGRTARALALACESPSAYATLLAARFTAAKTPAARASLAQQVVSDFHAMAIAGKLPMVKAMLAAHREYFDHEAIAAVLRETVRIPGRAQILACLLDPAQTGHAIHDVAKPGLERFTTDAQNFDVVAQALYPQDPTTVRVEDLTLMMHHAATLGRTGWSCMRSMAASTSMRRIPGGMPSMAHQC